MPGRFPPLECQNNLNHQSLIKRLEVHDKTTSNKTVLPETPVTAVVYPFTALKMEHFDQLGQENHLPNLQLLGEKNHVNLPGFPNKFTGSISTQLPRSMDE